MSAGAGEPTLSYVLEDDLHAETLAESSDKETALAEARRRAALPWDGPVNKPPCRNWRRCGRHLMLVTFDHARRFPDNELSTTSSPASDWSAWARRAVKEGSSSSAPPGCIGR